jgi:3-oxoacyl-[acyl-carrier protein] reductase
MTKERKNQVAIVTGASRGIGRAIVLKLAEDGYDIAFNYAKSKEAADQLEKEVKALGVKVFSKQVDIKELASVKTFIEETKQSLGQIDILVNNAGIIIDKPLMMMSEDDWNQVIDTNLNGCFNATKACVFTFMKQKKGCVINISSISGIIGLPGQTNYSATKGGINAFTKALAKEVAGFGIRVNAIAPGFIETEILSGFNEDKKKQIIDLIPLQRMGSVDDVANCVLFLLSDAANYMTGQIMVLDGGLSIC